MSCCFLHLSDVAALWACGHVAKANQTFTLKSHHNFWIC